MILCLAHILQLKHHRFFGGQLSLFTFLKLGHNTTYIEQWPLNFGRIAIFRGGRPIFLTLNKVINLSSGHLTIVAWRLFGHGPISSSNDQIFGRCPDRRDGNRRDSWQSPLGGLSSAVNIFQPISGQHCLLGQNCQVGTLNAINH